MLKPYVDKTARLLIAIALVTFTIQQAKSAPFTFNIKPGEPNYVIFISKAPLETIKGRTDRITGTLTFDPDNLAGASATFEVDMASLDTGNKMRNGHMRENHLHTDKYPASEFVLKEVIPGTALVSGKTVEFKIKGEFTLHGITKAIEPSVSATWNSDKREVEVVARFDVLLSDFEIPRPQFLVMKLDEKQDIEIHFTVKSTN